MGKIFGDKVGDYLKTFKYPNDQDRHLLILLNWIESHPVLNTKTCTLLNVGMNRHLFEDF